MPCESRGVGTIMMSMRGDMGPGDVDLGEPGAEWPSELDKSNRARLLSGGLLWAKVAVGRGGKDGRGGICKCSPSGRPPKILLNVSKSSSCA
ncbi:hypothetical protein D9M69_730670 [compost metagenome]